MPPARLTGANIVAGIPRRGRPPNLPMENKKLRLAIEAAFSKMKSKISVSMDDELITKLKEIVKKGRFRNNSHLIEYAVTTFIEDGKDNLV